MKNSYQARKEAARNEALEWMDMASSDDLSYGDICDAQDRFYTLGKRYGLLEEFRENGVPC